VSVLSVLHQVLADKACFLCGEESDLPVCSNCASSFRPCDPGWSDSHLAAGQASGFSAYWYEGTLRQAILQMKVQGEFQLAGQLSDMLTSLARTLPLGDRPVFVPIPRFGARDEGDPRHFPHVACKVLSTAFHGNFASGLLLKTRRTPLQTQLSDTERVRNVDGVFGLSSTAAEQMLGRTVVIVDDVLTTGATVCAAMNVILQARPHQCLYLTLARSRATIQSGL
jgi:predicted amidophosphoribosyltransferase